MFNFITIIFLFAVFGVSVLYQKELINELKSGLKEQDKRIRTLEEILSKQDAALGIKIKVEQNKYNPDKDPAIKKFMDELNRL